MNYVVNTSASLDHAAEKGLSPAFDRWLRPLKTKKKELRVLAKDVNGKQTGNREEQGMAFKVFLARRAKGTLKSFAQHAIEKEDCGQVRCFFASSCGCDRPSEKDC